MSPSQQQSAAREPFASPADIAQKSSVIQQTQMSFEPAPAPGSYDDSCLIRNVLIQSIKNCGKSRAQIAEEMELLLDRPITLRMIDGFTADSRSDRKWPAEYDRAFARVTGDDSIIACRAEMAGLHVISAEQKLLLDLGRQFLIRDQAEEQIAILQKRLHGRIG